MRIAEAKALPPTNGVRRELRTCGEISIDEQLCAVHG